MTVARPLDESIVGMDLGRKQLGPLTPVDAASRTSASGDRLSRLAAMQYAFLPSGGIVTGDCFGALLRHQFEQPISTLARWIVGRKIVSIEAGGQIWLPLFQFEAEPLRVRPGAQRVIEELREMLDDCELAEWFSRPNTWLQGKIPADLIAIDDAAVLQAARADRYLVTG